MAAKLGLSQLEPEDDALASDFLSLLAAEQCDFTLAFRRLNDLVSDESEQGVADLFDFPAAFSDWLERWHKRLESDSADVSTRLLAMKQANPTFIPRNHLVAEAIDEAVQNNDFSAFNHLVDLLSTPQDYHPDLARFALPPRPEQVVSRTFCGT